jgi:hypothetical protein
MKLSSKLLFLSFGIVIFFTQCTSEETYAQKLKKERLKFAEYVEKNGIQLSSDSIYCFSLPTPWPENLYYRTPRGAYINLVNKGTTKQAAEGSTVIVRYVATNIAGDTIANNTSTSVSRDGYEFIYRKGSSVPCIGWNDAMLYLNNNGRAKVIVESKIGFSQHQTSVITVISDMTVSITN